MSGGQDPEAALRARGLKVTPHRVTLLRLLSDEAEHMGAQALHRRLEAQGEVASLSTVYKNLELFCDVGLARAVRLPNLETRFGRAAAPHHHLVCKGCGEVQDLVFTVEQLSWLQVTTKKATADGWRLEPPQFTLFGLCARCRLEL